MSYLTKKFFYTLLLVSGITTAAEVPGFKGRFTLKVEPYTVEVTGEHKFCIQKIYYQGYVIGDDTGYYGTILANGKAKFIGAGHNEGGVEKVQSFALTVDGKPAEYKLGAVLTGKRIEYQKVSIQDNLKVYVKVAITKNGIRIDKHFEALDEQKIYSFYIFQYCFTGKTREWLIGRPDGTFADGVFKSDKGWHLRREREILWFSQFDPAVEKGIIGYFISYFPKQGKYMFWDLQRYHKFYFWANLPKVVPKGMKSPHYAMFLKGFDAKPADWKKEVKTLTAEMVKQYPPPKPPENTVYTFDQLPGKCLELKGNGKFVCKKLPANLKPEKQYKISFKIKKSPEVSRGASDNYILVGQHDKNRKFQSFGAFATRTPCDDQWHQESGVFKTPAQITVGNIFIYNKRTNASIWIDELKIDPVK